MIDPHGHFETQGFGVWSGVIDTSLPMEIRRGWHRLRLAHRGHDVDGKYHSKPESGVEWANYWTYPLYKSPAIQAIVDKITPILSGFINSPVFYHCDISVLTNKNTHIRPHVDTPYRHLPWNQSHMDQRLAVQAAVPLHKYPTNAGSTAFYPGSHLQHWDIKKCYRGEYNDVFMKNCQQPTVDMSDVLLWDARTLHSQMPNQTSANRLLLLMNFLDESIVEQVMQYESNQNA